MILILKSASFSEEFLFALFNRNFKKNFKMLLLKVSFSLLWFCLRTSHFYNTRQICLFSGKAAFWWNCYLFGWSVVFSVKFVNLLEIWFLCEFISHQKKNIPMKLAEIYEVMVDSLFATDPGANRLERNPSWTPSVDCGCWFSMDSPESLHLWIILLCVVVQII